MNVVPPGDDLGRIVVVAAGFALWKGGRCIAAARWADIKRVRAYRLADKTPAAMRLGVDLANGSVMEFHEAAPGFDLFLDRAQVVLPGLVPFASWNPGLMLAPAGGDAVVIFERPVVKRR
ncbi:MAG: hypothetical protein ABI625_11685 [bacterium]